MKRLPLGLVAAFCLPFWLFFATGCEDTATGGSKEPFSVKFSVASVPRGLPLDSISISLAVGDTGSAQHLIVDVKNGISKGTVKAYPGQKYVLSYEFFSGGYAIGKGTSEGTFSEDLEVALEPEWDAAKIDLAYAAVHSGKYLPAYLDSAYGVAVAGGAIVIALDSSAGKSYRWWVRSGDSVIAQGDGPVVDWTPADSLGGATVSVKILVLDGSTVVDEKKWDVRILAVRPSDRLQGIAFRPDTSTKAGSLTWYVFGGSGDRDSVLDFDTTVFVKGRKPVSTVAYTYADMAGRRAVQKAHRSLPGGETVDSSFIYDDAGRLVVLGTTLKSGTTVDSIEYGKNGSTETRSYAQGRFLRVVRHVRLSASETVDSVFSRVDGSLVLSRLVKSSWKDSLLVSSRTYVNKGGMVLSGTERYIYNPLGGLALRQRFAEGQSSELSESEIRLYGAEGRLERALFRDESAGELEGELTFEYVPATAALAKFSPGSGRAGPSTAFTQATAGPQARRNAATIARLRAYAAWDLQSPDRLPATRAFTDLPWLEPSP